MLAGIRANAHAYTAVMTLCQRAGQWQRAMQIFREMEAKGVTMDEVAYNSAIAACAKGGEWEQAWAVFSSEQLQALTPFSWPMRVCQKQQTSLLLEPPPCLALPHACLSIQLTKVSALLQLNCKQPQMNANPPSTPRDAVDQLLTAICSLLLHLDTMS